MSARGWRSSATTYQVLIETTDFGVPDECRELTDRIPELKERRGEEIVDVKYCGLRECLQLPANERLRVLHDVIGSDGVNREVVGVCGLQTNRVCRLLCGGPCRVCHAPNVFDNAEQDRMKYLNARVLCGIKT